VRMPVHTVMPSVALPLGVLSLALVCLSAGELRQPTPPAPADEAHQPRLAPVVEKARRLPGDYVASEPTIAVSADGHVIVAAMEGADQGATRLMLWRSEDSGKTWLAASYLPRSREVGMLQWDAWLQSAGRGKFVIAHCAGNDEGKGKGSIFVKRRPAAVVQRSEDSGKTWQRAPVFGRSVDKTVLAVSASGKQQVVAFTMFDPEKGFGVQVHRSADGGDTWDELPTGFAARRTHCYIADGIVVTDRGDVVVGWDVQAVMRYRRVVTSTTDGGKSWAEVNLTAADVHNPGDFLCKGPALALDGAGLPTQCGWAATVADPSCCGPAGTSAPGLSRWC
jgi:photosystem II stability/assembly factor-like uncharacterized protein